MEEISPKQEQQVPQVQRQSFVETLTPLLEDRSPRASGLPEPESTIGHAHSDSVHRGVRGSDSIELKDLESRYSAHMQAHDITPAVSGVSGEAKYPPTSLLRNITTDMASKDIINSLPPPPPYNLSVEELTIGVPPPKPVLPLPIPIPIPEFLRKKAQNSEAPLRHIVRNISAKCDSGEMLAIIGGSGSGKTTVLNAIVGRLANLPIEHGSISYSPLRATQNEKKILSARRMKDKIGFVKQTDTLLAHLTVRETLRYAAALRLPAGISTETREAIVTQTIEELGLRDAADTVVGGTLRKGISGGERRRLSIGCILVTMPSVLVADEPTTGLDATTSYNLLLTLSQLAKRNRTVVLTLHQPRSSAFPLFDRILLLSKGRVVYSGHRQRCFPWFASLNHVPGSDVNPLDWLIDVSTVDTREGREEESRQRVAALIDSWEDGGLDFVNKGDSIDGVDGNTIVPERVMSDSNMNASAVEVAGLLHVENWDLNRIGMLRQTVVLFSRANKNMYRNYGYMLTSAAQSMVLGVALGLAFFRLGETPADIQSLKMLCFQYVPYYTYLVLIFSIYKFCAADLIIFDREREDHLYAVAPWLISELLSNAPIQIISAAVFALIVYFMTNMRTDDLAANLFIFITAIIMEQFATIGFSLLAASINRIYATASLIANATQIFFAMSAGALLIRPPPYIDWVKYISSYYFGFRAVTISQFQNRQFLCENVVGIARNQCEGNQVLTGLRIPIDHNPGYYLAGLFGLGLVEYLISGILLATYHPGGVKHAMQVVSLDRGKEVAIGGDLDISRQRIDVEVKGLTFSWNRRNNRKTILHNVNAKFPAGQVTAILGPSGAGKSTLLQILSSRSMNPGPFARFETEGLVTLNGEARMKKSRSLVAFVEQEDDYHLPALTVRETLRYAAILRLPKSMSRKRKIARAEEVLRMLGLIECADTLVGGELVKGISGGEKRRLSLAVEMINDPSILVVDEPTSGLDSLTANNVMLALKSIAESGRTVIVSIHQPRSDIWHAGIDNVILLAKGGRTAYSGPKAGVEKMCASVGWPIPEMVNPADWILDMVSVDNRGEQENITRERVKHIVNQWEITERKSMEELATMGKPVDATKVIYESDGGTPFYISIPVIIDRMLRNLWRQQPGYSAAAFVLSFTLVELPFEIVGSLLFTVITNIGAGLQTNARIFFQYAFAVWALQSNGESFGMMFGVVTRDMGVNVSLVSAYISILVQLSGIVSASVPNWLSKLAWGTTLKYATRIIVVNEATGLQLNCTQTEIQNGECLIQNGQDLLNLFGFKDLRTGRFCAILLAVTIAYRILAWAFVRAKVASL
ncbi:hypothetical protein FRC02_002035 [Tulasnella sp. 418]|nr:hypothetical protein FRC02_002035 [Tulasnella sp. 418]